jgi:hypothetical protein
MEHCRMRGLDETKFNRLTSRSLILNPVIAPVLIEGGAVVSNTPFGKSSIGCSPAPQSSATVCCGQNSCCVWREPRWKERVSSIDKRASNGCEEPDQAARGLPSRTLSASRVYLVRPATRPEPNCHRWIFRRSDYHCAQRSPLHLVGTWAADVRLCLGQLAVVDKSNETVRRSALLPCAGQRDQTPPTAPIRASYTDLRVEWGVWGSVRVIAANSALMTRFSARSKIVLWRETIFGLTSRLAVTARPRAWPAVQRAHCPRRTRGTGATIRACHRFTLPRRRSIGS